MPATQEILHTEALIGNLDTPGYALLSLNEATETAERTLRATILGECPFLPSINEVVDNDE